MLTREELLSVLQNNNIGLFETNYCLDNELDIVLKTEDINVLIKLMKENAIHSAFYSFEYLDEDDYLITNDDFYELSSYSDFGEEIFERWKDDILEAKNKFNQKIDRKLFYGAISLNCFCIFSGLQVGICQKENWEERLPSKSEFLVDLFLEFEEKLLQEKRQAFEEKQENDENNLKKIIDYIEATDEWHSRTNKRLRQLYCAELIEKFEKEYGIKVSYYSLYDEFQLIWMRYKQERSKK